MIRVLIIILLILSGLAAIGLALWDRPGHVLIAMSGLQIDLSLIMFALLLVVLFVGLYIAVRLLFNILGIPVWVSRKRESRHRKKAYEDLAVGLHALEQGHWDQADKYLTRSANYSARPAVHFLSAARAAHMHGDFDRRDSYLARAQDLADESDITAGLTHAELLLEDGRTAEAEKVLDQLVHKTSDHDYANGLLARCYAQQEKWTPLAEILSKVKKAKVLPESEVTHLEHKATMGLMQSAAHAGDVPALRAAWAQQGRDAQGDAEILAQYVGHLRSLGEIHTAETVVRNALEAHWSERLAYEYGRLQVENPTESLSHAEKWLPSHEKSPALLLTLGRFCKQAKLWGKARSYFEASLAIHPSPEVYAELATLLDQLGENEAAHKCNRLGLTLAVEGIAEPILAAE